MDRDSSCTQLLFPYLGFAGFLTILKLIILSVTGLLALCGLISFLRRQYCSPPQKGGPGAESLYLPSGRGQLALKIMLVVTLFSYLASSLFNIFFTIYAKLYDFIELERKYGDQNVFESYINADTLASEIEQECDLNLKHIEKHLAPLVVLVLALQVTMVFMTYSVRILVEFEGTAFQISRVSKYVILACLGVMIVCVLLYVMLFRIENLANVGDSIVYLGFVAYLTYLVGMCYVCRLYIKNLAKLSIEQRDDIEALKLGVSDNAVTTRITDKLSVYSVTATVAYASDLLAAVFIFVDTATDNVYTDLLQGNVMFAAFAIDLAAVLWQFGMMRRVYLWMCLRCHRDMQIKCMRKVGANGAVAVNSETENLY